MALDYFDIGGRIAKKSEKGESKKKKTSKRGDGPKPSSFRASSTRTTAQSPSANTGGGDAAKADAERKAREAEQNRLGAEAARKYATSGSESLAPGQYKSAPQTPSVTRLPGNVTGVADTRSEHQKTLNYMKEHTDLGNGKIVDTRDASDRVKDQLGRNTIVNPEQYAQAQRQQAADREDYAKQREKKRAGDFDNTFKEMTWEDYNNLTDRQKAAIDWNSMMETAYKRDRKQAKKLGGVDKRLTLDEIAPEKRDAYRRSYQRIFGESATDNEIDYSPRMVAMLDKVLGSGLNLGSAKEVLRGGQAFITDKDLTNGNIEHQKQQKVTATNGAGNKVTTNVTAYGDTGTTTDRRAWISKLVDYQQKLTDGLRKSKILVNNQSERIDLNKAGSDQLGTMVEQAAAGTQADPDNWGINGMVASGAIDRSGINLGGLLTPGQARRNEEMVQAYNEVGQQLQAQNWSLDYLNNEGFMRGVAKQRGLDENRWLELSRNMKKAGEKNSQTALDKVLYGEKEG